VTVGAVAHGGHCVARAAGRVLFVRHALPGERVVVEVTEVGRRGRFLRADAVEVLEAAPGRREPPCPVAASCGGCDWQHATPEASRALKTAVVREALERFAGITLPASFAVAAVADPGQPGRDDGLGWRTRGALAVGVDGRAGFRAPRSHAVVAGGTCPQLHPALAPVGLLERAWPPGARVGFVAPAQGPPSAHVRVGDPVQGRAGASRAAAGAAARAVGAGSPGGEGEVPTVVEWAAGRPWQVAADGFWQVHPGAADALVGHVRRMLAPAPGERLVDLYAGVGLFGLSLAATLHGALTVTLVEGDRRACELAGRNAASDPPASSQRQAIRTGDATSAQAPAVDVVRAPVDRWVGRRGALDGVDLVVLDPPRAGAGPAVVEAVAAARPRAIAYVACDPVALARDLAAISASGYRLVELVGLDLFPTTHHVECVAHLAPA
jgi:tRNA/tmRNA/rRNA uracil-C5-methylase (TrmA/RlmC/RlmD family)